MTESLYAYDRDLFSRNFLNCAQRHSVVMLKERGIPVEYLFYNSLVSTDQALEQMIRRQVPKYDFESDCLSFDDLERLGVTRREVFDDRFEDIKAELLSCIARDGFVLLAGDVFYFPHCPEYREKHLFHLVVLKGYDEARNEWLIVDDNPASVLCDYRYSEQEVAAFYENSTVREYRCFQQMPVAGILIRDRFGEASHTYLTEFGDSYRLLTDVQAILDNPWLEQGRILAGLHDAFSILLGSRVCYAAFIDLVYDDGSGTALARDAASAAEKIRDSLVRAKLTGRLNPSRLQERCDALMETEERLLARVRSLC